MDRRSIRPDPRSLTNSVGEWQERSPKKERSGGATETRRWQVLQSQPVTLIPQSYPARFSKQAGIVAADDCTRRFTVPRHRIINDLAFEYFSSIA